MAAAPGSSRTPSGRIPKPAAPGSAVPSTGPAGNPGTRRLPAAGPAGAASSPSRGGTQRLVKPGTAPAGTPPAAPGPRASQAMRASSRISRPPPPTDVPLTEGGDEVGPPKIKKGVDYWIKYGALLSIPILLVILALLYWYKKTHAPDPGDPNANKPPIKPIKIEVDPTQEPKEWARHAFDLRQEAMTAGDPAKRKKLLEEAKAFFEKALNKFRQIQKQFPDAKYGLDKDVDQAEKTLAYVEKELNPPKEDVTKAPPDYDEAMKIKAEGQKKYAASFDEKNIEDRKQLLLDAITLLERAKKTLKLCKEGANDFWKKKCESELPAFDSCIKASNDELDRLNKETPPPTPPETPGESGEQPPPGESGK